MLAAGADKHASPVQGIARLGFLDTERAALIQPAGKHLRESLGHVLHDYYAPGKIRRQLRQNILKGLWASGRDADGNNLRRLAVGDRTSFFTFYRFRQIADLNTAAVGCGLDLGNQLLPTFLHSRSNVGRLSDEIKSSKRQGLQRYRSALSAMRTDHDHWQAMAAPHLPQHIEPAHTGHLQIQCYQLRF